MKRHFIETNRDVYYIVSEHEEKKIWNKNDFIEYIKFYAKKKMNLFNSINYFNEFISIHWLDLVIRYE